MEFGVYRSAKAVWIGGIGQGPPQTTGSITSPAYAIQAETVFAKAYFSHDFIDGKELNIAFSCVIWQSIGE